MYEDSDRDYFVGGLQFNETNPPEPDTTAVSVNFHKKTYRPAPFAPGLAR